MPYLGQRPSKGDENNFKILDDISSHTLTFDGTDASIVSAANDTITLRNHRFIQGQRVTYNKGSGGTVIPGLSDGVYYIIKDDHNTIKLATTASNASNGVVVNITGVAPGGSSHTLNVAFDGVNTKFKATHTNGVKAKITRSAQLVISINGVIQQPHDSATPSTGFGFDLDGTIVFSQAPVASDEYWAHLLTNNNVTFDISNNDVDNFTGDGSTTTFNLSKTPSDNRNVLVTIDGVVQYPSDPTTTRAYNVVENVITFTTAPVADVQIQVRHIGFAGSTSGGSSGGVTSFYGRTGAVVLKNTDNIVANNAEFAGNLTVQGTTTTLDTVLTEVDKLEVAANNTTVGVAITQSGSGDILNLYDGSTEVFSVADGGKVDILATDKFLTLKKAANGNYCGLELDRDNSGTEGGIIGLAGANGHFITSSSQHDLTIRSANGTILFGNGQTEVLRTNPSGVNVTGTLTLPDSIIHTDDTNTKIRFPANDTISFETAGSERLRIDNNGKVTIGIGASAVDNVFLTIPRLSTTGSALRLYSLRNDSAPADLDFVKSRSTTYGSYSATQDDDIIMAINSYADINSGVSFRGTYRSIYDTSTGGVHFQWGSGTAPSTSGEKMRLTATGNVGIGSVIPEQRLTVVGATDIKHYANTTINNDRLQLGFNAPEGYIKAKNSAGSPAANIALYTTDTSGNTNRIMHLRYNGDVGIGTHNPRYSNSLDIFGKHLTLSEGFPLSWLVGSTSTFRGRFLCDSGGNYIFQFGSGNEEKIRFKSNGNVGIATNNPAERLVVQGDGFSNLAYDQDGGGFDGTSGGALVLSGIFDYSGSKLGLMVDNAGQGRIMTKTGQTLYLGTNNTRQLSINNIGYVGIKTTNALAHLDLRGVSGSGSPTMAIHHSNADVEGEVIRIGRTDLNTIRYHSIKAMHGGAAANNYIGFNLHNGSSTTSQTEVMRVVGSGRVAIGTDGYGNTAPLAPLHVSSYSPTTTITTFNHLRDASQVLCQTSNNVNNSRSGITFTGALHSTDGCSAGIIANHENVAENSETTSLSFYTSHTETLGERLRITSDGRLKINHTSTSSKLDDTWLSIYDANSDSSATNPAGISKNYAMISLHNYGTGNNGDTAGIGFGAGSGFNYVKGSVAFQRQGSYGTGDLVFLTNNDQDSTLVNNNNERMRIRRDGAIVIPNGTLGLRFGGDINAGTEDFAIFHSGSNSHIDHFGTGNLLIDFTNNFNLRFYQNSSTVREALTVTGGGSGNPEFTIKSNPTNASVNSGTHAPIVKFKGAGWNTNSGSTEVGTQLQSVHNYWTGNYASYFGQTYPDFKIAIKNSDSNSYVEKFAFSGNGVMRLQSGGGINFNNYGSGSNISSNTLDDYEEGLWQPQVLDGNGSNYTINYTSANCRYTKIGRMVFCYYVITRTESGSKTGNLRFYATTLPFAPDETFHGGSYWVDHGGPTTGQGDIVGGIHYGTSNGVYWVFPTRELNGDTQSTAPNRYLQHGQWTNGRPIYGMFHYTTTA